MVEVSQHLSVERDLLYPLISHHITNGKDIVDDLRHAERQLEERLGDFESDATEEHGERLKETIEEHIAQHEELFTRLRELLPESELLKPVETVALSIGGSPTHAHPHLAESGPIGKVIEDLTSAADHTRDWLHHGKNSGGS